MVIPSDPFIGAFNKDYIMDLLRSGYIAFAKPASFRNMFKRNHIFLRGSNSRKKLITLFSSMTDSVKQKTYHKKASGSALATVRKHSKDHELKLFGSCFW
jgi:hypothetical protein